MTPFCCISLASKYQLNKKADGSQSLSPLKSRPRAAARAANKKLKPFSLSQADAMRDLSAHGNESQRKRRQLKKLLAVLKKPAGSDWDQGEARVLVSIAVQDGAPAISLRVWR